MKKRTPKWLIALIIVVGCAIFILPITVAIYMISNPLQGNYEVSKNGIVMINDGEMMIDGDIHSYYDEETSTYYVIGYVENLSKSTKNIEIAYKLYDDEKNVIGIATAYMDRVAKKEKWKFKAKYQEIDAKEVSKYKLESVYVD